MTTLKLNQAAAYKPRFSSPSFLVLVSVSAFFVWTQYELAQSALFSSDLIRNFGTYSGLMKLPWWIATFYGSELGGSVGGILRWLASFLALYCAFVYWRRGDSVLPQIKGKIGAALALEGVYFLFLIPSVILGFVFPFTAGKVWYFDVTPVPEVFFVAGIACLLMVLVMPPVLFKLRQQIVKNAPRPDIARWAAVAGVAYLFVVFWFNSAMQWTGMLATWGQSLLADPWNLLGFGSSVFAVFLVAWFAMLTVLPAIRKQPVQLSLSRLGAVTAAFGAYFVFAISIYFASGGYAAHRSAWYELIVPHNPYTWCVVFLFAGLAAMSMQAKNIGWRPNS